MEGLLSTEPAIRLLGFALVFLVMAILETLSPRRPLAVRKSLRWSSNLGLAVINALTLRVLAPVGATGVALAAQTQGWGLMHIFTPPPVVAFIIANLTLDFAIYLQHRLFHSIPMLWRLHKVHHTDLDFDASTGLRFHTIEIMLSFAIKCLVIIVIGASPSSVLAFEVILNGTAIFNHSNVHLPKTLDRILRACLVTPDMHRVHHSVIPQETNSNFGFNLAWWDRLLGTYRPQPEQGHRSMTIGLPQFQDEKVERLTSMLRLPFSKESQPDD